MSILEIITAAVSVISLPLLVVQVHLAARGIAADHLRRKQQATLEYLVVHLRTHFSADLRAFTERFGDADLGEDDLARLRADSEANALVVPLLGSIEHLAVGVNMGVYDQELLNRASGAFLIRTFHRFHAYIKAVQIKLPTAYVEFQTLVRNLEAARESTRQPLS